MENFLILLAFTIVLPALFNLIDRRIKGCHSLLGKIVSAITVTAFLYLMVYFYGQSIVSIFRVNIKSFTNMKAFFTGRMLVIIALLIFVLFIAFKCFFISIAFRNMKKTFTSAEKILTITMVVFDLALVPNIFINSALLSVFAILTALELGLVYIKLVFSNTYVKGKEVLA